MYALGKVADQAMLVRSTGDVTATSQLSDQGILLSAQLPVRLRSCRFLCTVVCSKQEVVASFSGGMGRTHQTRA